ncbi:hypothetical protein RIR_jg13121.t1 [Rhizophagus irregularis DAOM 181602=DAOM 197198]|nr:hypothetical protein RIR_jg13121.t1 [Rhizophagus irregularis DAOM 181602=DAOM 197198]
MSFEVNIYVLSWFLSKSPYLLKVTILYARISNFDEYSSASFFKCLDTWKFETCSLEYLDAKFKYRILGLRFYFDHCLCVLELSSIQFISP